jgi:hypothetical protein
MFISGKFVLYTMIPMTEIIILVKLTMIAII